MKNDKSIKLEKVYYSIDNSNQYKPISLWTVNINQNEQGYGYEDDADIFGTALNVTTQKEGLYQGYINPSYPDTYNTQEIRIEEEYGEFGNIETKYLDCYKLENIISKQEKFKDINELRMIYNHLVVLDYKESLSIDDLVKFEGYINQNIKDKYENLFGENLKSIASGLREAKNKETKILFKNNNNDDELSMKK